MRAELNAAEREKDEERTISKISRRVTETWLIDLRQSVLATTLKV